LVRVPELHPAAKRVLPMTYGDRSVARPIWRAMTPGQIDEFFGKPWGPPEQRLYPMVSDLLGAWSRRTAPSRLELVRVVGPRWSRRYP
jgi:thioredoxin reductase (NADPH)